jgi:hypothetical protein
MTFESREPPIPRRFSALLSCLRAVIRGELSILRRSGEDLPHFVPRVAGHTRHHIGHCRIPDISGPVALIANLIASEGGDVPLVRSRISRARDLRAFP